MAAPKFAPVPPANRARGYESPEHVPGPWAADRSAEIRGRQPEGNQLGYQGPDQGYAMLLAERLRPKVRVTGGEAVDDALRGCLNVGLRRASLFGRAPVIHDITLALTIWGFLADDAPDELVTIRRRMFEGVAVTLHNYAEGRTIADLVPEATLRLSPAQAVAAFPARWRELLGL